MIVLESELQIALGLTDPTDTERARLALAMAGGHAAVRRKIGYDPEQKEGVAELYPRREVAGADIGGGYWDVNPSHTLALWHTQGDLFKFLQLERLPVRSVTSVFVDPSAYYGQKSGDFGTGTDWTQGDEFYVEWDSQQSANVGVCRSGQLIAVSAWPAGIGTVKVTYRAGYSQDEFRGPAASSSIDSAGIVTTQGVDASALKAGTLLTCMAKYMTLKSFSVSSLTGVHAPGPFSSESLGDYSYSLANPQAAALISGMAVDVPPEAMDYLSDFVNYGVLVL
jgi:hypothetical protein